MFVVRALQRGRRLKSLTASARNGSTLHGAISQLLVHLILNLSGRMENVKAGNCKTFHSSQP